MEQKLQEFESRLMERSHEYLGIDPPSDDDLFSVKGFAKLCGGLSPYTVEMWLSKKIIIRTKVGGRTMIRRRELRKVVEEGGRTENPRTRQATAAAEPATAEPPRRGRGRPRKDAAA